MQCPRCRAENREGRRFCGECGLSFASTCTSCGFQNEGTEKFCGGCGAPVPGSRPDADTRFASPESYTPKHLAERILTSRSALEGERKQVTVLFADLKGSMELLADRDPEEARKILDPILELMMEAIHRYEGTVNQVMGDGIMALFGAPVAHEDHAVRACYAALRMQQAVKTYADEVRRAEGVPIRIRVGLNSGEVVVRSIGSDLRMDYTAVGQTTHLAARMEQMADPGAILLTAGTLRLAEGFVQIEALGPLTVKGLPAPVETFSLTGATSVRSRLQAAAARGLTRFVGREAEMDVLFKGLEQARLGPCRVVAVVGEPGVGKSRLVWEFTHSHLTQGCLILEASSVSYGKASTYLPVINLLKGYFQLEPRDDARKIREKVTGKLLSLDRILESCLAPICWLLDVPPEEAEWDRLDAAVRRQRLRDSIRRVLLRESQVQPLVLIFDDLHWIDGETQALLDGIVEGLPTARNLLLVIHRPEYTHGWGSETCYSQVHLDALPSANAAELLQALLGPHPSVAALAPVLISRTEANPFFLEESVRTLVETRVLIGERGAYQLARPLETIQIPATVQAVLAARIDRLGPEDNRLLQSAAVVGKDVPWPLLQAVAELPDDALRQGLAHLQAAELIYETQLFPDLEYTFKHALTQEVTYGGLLAERRRILHRRIVDAIESLYPERLPEHVERLAHHALRGELREKAVHYLRQAGLKAVGRSALADARAWFEQALEVLASLPESPSTLEQGFDIRLELRPVLLQFGEGRRMLERLREAETLAERLNDDHRRGRVCAFMTSAHSILGELDEALVTGNRALGIAGSLGDLRLRILATTYLEMAHYYRGEYERAVELATDNLAVLPADWVYENLGIAAPPSVYDRAWLVQSLAELGRFAEAAEPQAEALRIAEPTRHAFTVGLANRAARTLHLLRGDWAKARSLFEQEIAVARPGNVVSMLADVVSVSAWVLAQLDETTEALEQLREGEQLLERVAAMGIVHARGWDYHSLGRACLSLGRLDEAQRLGDRAVEFSQRQPGYAAHALHLLGDIATHPDRFDAERGETHYRQALTLAEPRGMRPLIAHCHLGLGNLYRRTGKRDQAQEHLTTATAMYREMDMRFWLERVEAEMKELA